MPRSIASALALALTLLAGCDDGRVSVDGSVALDADTSLDGGTAIDGGGAPIDGGGAVDAGRRDGGTLPPGIHVDPSCTDGLYTEAIPDVDADISDIAFTEIGPYVDAVLDRRYPVGADLVAGGRMHTGFGMDCDILFAGGASSGADVIGRLGTIVHECGHFFDLHLSSGSTSVYEVTGDLRLSCQRGDATNRGGDTFARSRINDDAYSALRPPCGGSGSDCDRYADIYLDGDPDDGTFQGGDQGFNMLFEETVQYVNSLAVAWAFVDQRPAGQRTSARDGLLTFLWYTERYLRRARLQDPDAYARITDPCWRDAILEVWGRAWLYLEATEGITALGIADATLMDLVTDPELLEEIQRLRDLEGC